MVLIRNDTKHQQSPATGPELFLSTMAARHYVVPGGICVFFPMCRPAVGWQPGRAGQAEGGRPQMLEATKPVVAVKNIDTPDERHAFEHASLNVVNLPGVTIARTVYQPGWKWSTDVRPVVGTQACQAIHTGYIISGRLHARMDDGREYDFGPGDAHVMSAGHDAWVEGDEPCVVLDVAFTGRALAGHVGRCPCGVEFRVASDDQFGQLVAAIREHARSSHGHELSTQQVLAEVTA